MNRLGGSQDPTRDGACTPKWLADAIGPVDLDPCSNDRSHIQATVKLDSAGCDGRAWPASTRTYINPPYSRGSVIQWVEAFLHTDFIFLLRLDSSTRWFRRLMGEARWMLIPHRRIQFDPPPGIKYPANAYPHALYCRSMPRPELAQIGALLRNHALADGVVPV